MSGALSFLRASVLVGVGDSDGFVEGSVVVKDGGDVVVNGLVGDADAGLGVVEAVGVVVQETAATEILVAIARLHNSKFCMKLLPIL